MRIRRSFALAILLAPPSGAQVTDARIVAALDKGQRFLERTYAESLERGNLEATERVGQSALSLYTLLKVGAEHDGETVRRLLLHVSCSKPTQTYDVACTLLALAAHDPMAHRPWVDELAQQLEAWQTADGDWGYPAGPGDLSNTQYAALGLWAASRCGYEADRKVWLALATATLDYGASEGGFAYAPGNARRQGATGSMTAAGVGTLAICDARLRRANAMTPELEGELSLARERGLAWLAKHFSVETNPGGGGWHFYYLYGLERVGAFVGAPTIGEHDWYAEGAKKLVELQGEDGSWNAGTDLSETCFALLFLRRATAYDSTPRTGDEAAQSDAAVRLDCRGDGPVSFAIAGWRAKDMAEIEWPGERGRGPHVTTIEYLVDGELAAVEVGSPSRPAGGARFRTAHVFEREGKHEVRARANVKLHDGSTRVLESQTCEVLVARALPAWLLDPRPRALDDLLPGGKAKANASSTAKRGKTPLGFESSEELAIDGNPRTPWLAAEGDDDPELSVTLQRGKECRVVQVRAAVLEPLGSQGLSRPLTIEVSINGKSRGTLAMSPDPRQPMRLVLDAPTVVKRIDLAITAVAKSESCPLVGIGEVELFERAP